MVISAKDSVQSRKHTSQGMVFNIQFHSTEDGPGIRTSIFFKGCSMKCPWCHNPEGIKSFPELIWYDVRCIGAKDCIEACPESALTLTPEGMIIDRKKCTVCGNCETACPTNAMEIVGKWYSVDEIVGKALQDKVFYKRSGGGVTFSGGEASLQTDFVLEVMQRLKTEGVHLTVDTCGGVAWEKLRPLVENADLVLYDLKSMDPSQHLLNTGIPLDLILENAEKIAQTGKSMWVRTPIIPGFNDTKENIQKTVQFIKNHLPVVQRYDLLAFNNTCSIKYRRLGLPWPYEDNDLLTEDKMQKLADTAEEGLDCIHWSGLTRHP